MSTVVRSEVAGRSAGIDWRRGFDPIDRSISVDSRTIFSSLIQRGNFREEINIDGVADAPSGVLKIALHRDVSPLLSACVV